ncbi:MAG: ATPase [Nanoarchaeota archaeon]|nr:ATPase [Nanoarchaeota archaeon]
MAHKSVREYDAKKMVERHLKTLSDDKIQFHGKYVLVTQDTDFEKLALDNPWLKQHNLVAKPDELFGKRGKLGLVSLNKDFDATVNWIKEKSTQDTTIKGITNKLTYFLIEPFFEHDTEYYVSMQTQRDYDEVFFSLAGGINVEENWDKVKSVKVPVLGKLDKKELEALVPTSVEAKERSLVIDFLFHLYQTFCDLDFAFFEINPFAVVKNEIIPLDMVLKVDDTASYKDFEKWGEILFPPSFGKTPSKEEAYVKSLDEKTGASLKLTLINPKGRIWTLVAGGGASVIYTDTIVDLGLGDELATYGEYSGDPNTEMTYEYTKTVLDLMTRKKDPEKREKFLLIGGGIANFTDVAKTFTGIIMALKEYKEKLTENNVKIFVRRGGPNYQEGLKQMKALGSELGVPIEVYGPETHMTKIVSLALSKMKKEEAK